LGFISYNESGLRYFLFLSIPVLTFLILYAFCYLRYGKKTEESRAYYLSSHILIVYVFVFFVYMFLGLRFLYLISR